MTSASGKTLTYNYDYLRRLSSVAAGIYTRSYTYKDLSSTQTTTQVSKVSYSGLSSNPSYGYTYDALGYIATYTAPDGEVITYTYDSMGQLLKAAGDTTYTYTYDGFGNLKTANGHTYTYGNTDWRDLLTAFDGQSITYDASGNPTSYYNGTRWTFGWAEGRNLVSASGGGNTVTYAYDHNGVRTTKTVNGTAHTYTYASGKLLRETYGSNTLDFFYDASGTPFALNYNNGTTTTTYYYITNLQGDVMQLVNASGAVVASYEYDPYGSIITATGTMASVNPLRYRGYYFDSDTGFYYLQSRYYDPSVGRFINADSYTSTGQGIVGHNMFVYCLNNPILHTDPSGTYATTKNEFSYNFYDEGLGGSGYAGGSGGGAIIIPEIVTLLEDTATAIIAAVATMANVLEYRGQHVYILTDPSDGLVKYVGRTNDPIRRLYEHQNDIRHPERKNYEMTVLMSGLTLDEARFYEQTLISAFTLGYLENARREISVGNMNKYWAYLDAASEVFGVSEMGLWDLLGGS